MFSSNYGQRPNSANATTNDKCNNVFFGDLEISSIAMYSNNTTAPADGLQPHCQRQYDCDSPTHRNKMSRNISVESANSNTNTKQRLRKSRSRSSIRPPDGGYGWVVVFASFIISMIADGISFSFGVFFVDLSNYFGASKGKTAFAGSLFLSMPLLIGPLASALTDRFGCRWVTIVSGLLSASGFILGYFATSLEHLFIAFSISGAGLALSYVTSIVIVAYYFERKRSLATGLAVCGTGFGTFIFAPLTIHLLETYSWRGTMLIMAGVFLNIVVCGALMRDLPTADADDDGLSDPSCDLDSDNNYERMQYSDRFQQNKENKPDENRLSPPDINGDYSSGSSGLAKNRLFSSLVHIPTYMTHRGSNCDPQEIMNELTQRKDGYLSQLLQRYPQVLASFFFGQKELPRAITNNNNTNSNANNNARRAESRVQLNPPVVRSPSPAESNMLARSPESGNHVRSPKARTTASSSVANNIRFQPDMATAGAHLRNTIYLNLKKQRGSISISSYRSAMQHLRRHRKLRASSCPDIYQNDDMLRKRRNITDSNSNRNVNCFDDVKDTFSDLIDFSIFRSVKYTLFCISNLLLYMCIDVPYVYLPDHAIESGAAEKEASSFLISVIGIVNTLGIVLVGYIGDIVWIDSATLYAIFICGSGLSIVLIPFVYDYLGLATLAALYGFTISANYALVSVILVDLISLDKFTNGYGLLLLVQGIASLIGPPFAGVLCDFTGSYDYTFYVTGICIFVSGAIVIPVAGTDATGGNNSCMAVLLSAKRRVAKGAKSASSPVSKGHKQQQQQQQMMNVVEPLLDTSNETTAA